MISVGETVNRSLLKLKPGKSDQEKIKDMDNVQIHNLGEREKEGESEFCYGEHVACFWYDDHNSRYQWHLGIIDGMNGEKVVVSYMKRSDRVGRNWLFLEKADAHATCTEQIQIRHIQVNYTLTAMIRCQISSETIGQIETELNKINIH